jgi:YfiH family protein
MEPFQLRTPIGDASLMLLQSWCEPDGLTAGFTKRQALNTALHIGDNPESVGRNRDKIVQELGWSLEAFTCAEQVHSNHVHVVTREDRGRGREDRLSAIPDTDAMITNEPDILLAMFFADCVPLYFYDPVTGSMGLAHAGWKGTVAEVAVSTVNKMTDIYGALPENMIAAIGPSIGRCCYEVDESVLEQVRPLLSATQMSNSQDENLQGAHHEIIKQQPFSSRAYLDLKHLNQQIMIKAGIMPSNIEISSWCTACHVDTFYSHRKEKGATGRMMSWMGRKSR